MKLLADRNHVGPDCSNTKTLPTPTLAPFVYFGLVKVMLYGTIADDSQRRFLAQNSVAILARCYNHSTQLSQQSRVTSPLVREEEKI